MGVARRRGGGARLPGRRAQPAIVLALAMLALPAGCALHRHGQEPGASIQVTIGGAPAVVEPAPGTAPSPQRADSPSARGLLDRSSGPLLAEELRVRSFDLAWRRVRDGFYDPAFNGVNWDSIGALFRP